MLPDDQDQTKCSSTCGWFCIVCAIVFTVAAFVVPFLIHRALIDGLKEDTLVFSTTSRDSAGFKAWQLNINDKKASPIDFIVRMYNVTNPMEVANHNAKPIIVELGPWVYHEVREKINITFASDSPGAEGKETVSYIENKYFLFDRDQSFADEDYMVTIPNLAYLGAYYQARKGGTIAEEVIEGLFNETDGVPHSFTRRSVKEILFGYIDPGLAELKKLTLVDSAIVQLQPNCSSMSTPWTCGYNDWGYKTVFTGQNSNDYEVNRLLLRNNQAMYDKWLEDVPVGPANVLGLQFKFGISRGDHLPTWVEQFKRIIVFDYRKDMIDHGITLYQFKAPVSLGYNNSVVPSNWKFRQWHRWGVFNLSGIEPAPILFSKPRFLDADPQYRSDLIGMGEPDRETMDTYIAVEPITGRTLNADKNLQVNVNTHPTMDFPNHRNVLMPVAWIEEKASISTSLASEFRDEVYGAIRFEDYGRWGSVALAVVCLFIGLVLLRRAAVIRKQQEQQWQQTSINDDERLAHLLTASNQLDD